MLLFRSSVPFTAVTYQKMKFEIFHLLHDMCYQHTRNFQSVCFEMFISSIPYAWRSEYCTQINSSHWVTKSMFPLSNEIYIYQELACCPTELFFWCQIRVICVESFVLRSAQDFTDFPKKAMIQPENSRHQVVTLSGFLNEEPQILGSTAQNVVAGHILCFVLFVQWYLG